jgi:sugar phosphate isomerase/epimerase
VRVGTDTSKFPGSVRHGALWTLERVSELGLDGAFFRSALDLSRTLDVGEVREVAELARERGLYLEVGAGKVNPFATPETPEIRDLGNGDFVAGMTRIVETLASAGIHRLWAATANYQFRLAGLRACDRFRTDISWPQQLTATAKVLRRLAPVLEGCGSRLALETHEEVTTFECLRLLEETDSPALGITLDIANVVVRGEDPVAATRRVAPHVVLTQLRDVALLPTEEGLGRFLVPVGEGIVDWPTVLGILAEHAPGVNLSIEGVEGSHAEMPLFLDIAEWHASHVDLTDAELGHVLELARGYQELADAGRRPDLARLRAELGDDDALDFIRTSAGRLRKVLEDLRPATEGVHAS